MNERAGISMVRILAITFVIGLVGGLLLPGHDDRDLVERRHLLTTAGTPASSSSPTNENAPVALTSVDRSGLETTIAQLKGKVVLVDFWATWCLPCVEQLPHALELGKRLADRGFAVVTVSCDEPADADQVGRFLTAKKAAGAINLISQFGGSPKSMEAFEIATGAVPFYKLYDRAGKLTQTFGINPSAKKQYTAADIDEAVEGLLGK
jgi:thiol-disulfide isomerase/thioredoxin